MTDRDREPYQKGFFGRAGLPVAGRYLYPAGQRRVLQVGAVALFLVLSIFLVDRFVARGRIVSNGPLSVSHALFAEDCTTCHAPFEGVTDGRCASCHEESRDPLGQHTFAAHYVYRSGEFDRSAPSSEEYTCAACHGEHAGRDASLTDVPDNRCVGCHTFGSFQTEHPEFHFAAEGLPDPANLRFSHTLHVNEIRDRVDLDDVEETCLLCHSPTSDGRAFQPIAFDPQCGGCHLTTGSRTGWLPVRGGGSGTAPGVLTLDAIRREGGPATLWTQYANPADFQRRGAQIQKRPLYHQDPWVLDNLRRLRTELYGPQPLADLLTVSANVLPNEARVLYEEAIQTLRAQLQGLRDEPSREAREELSELETLIEVAEERLRDPFAPTDESRFRISAADVRDDLSAAAVEAYGTVVDSLTAGCRLCHFVEQATIKRVQKDQRSLHRAEFDHGAHTIHMRCLDCHNVIPIREYTAEMQDAPLRLDNAEILNLPDISACRTCHTESKAADNCTACHLFHPSGPGSQ